MQFTRFTDYSMRTLMYLSVHRDRRCTVKEISDAFGISLNHTVKIVHNLVKLGYVESAKGRGGGVWLALDPEKIRLGKLVVELEPNFDLVECFDRENNTCRIVATCGLKGILKEARDSFLNTLAGYSLADTVTEPAQFRTTLDSFVLFS